MDADNLHKSSSPANPSTCELVLQNGRLAGTRRPLGMPMTFIGHSVDCEIRLSVDGVDALHCVLAVQADGVLLRDLNSSGGSFVNEKRVQSILLQHGDVLRVGPFQFRLELPVTKGQDPLEQTRAALRVQAAAVAAQQAALDQEEVRLAQRRLDLQQQEEQLAAHMAQKHQLIQVGAERVRNDRDALRQERAEQEKRLAQREQEALQTRQDLNRDYLKLTRERERIQRIYQRLRQRWQRHWAAEKDKHQAMARRLEEERNGLLERDRTLRLQEAGYADEVRRFNTERELGTRALGDARAALARERSQWRQRRALELRALKARRLDGEGTLAQLHQVREVLVHQKQEWEKQQTALIAELHGLNDRVLHQRSCIQRHQQEIAQLDGALAERRRKLALPTSDDTAATLEPVKQADSAEPILSMESALPQDDKTPASEAVLQRHATLMHLAGDLADQRLHLVEQYQRLAEIQELWQRQRDQASADLEALATRLVEQEHSLIEREEQCGSLERGLQARHEEFEAVRQEVQVWRAQLRAREASFASEHEAMVQTLHAKDSLLDEQLAALAQLRQRWNQRRAVEIEQLRTHLKLLDASSKEVGGLRSELSQKTLELGAAKRALAEKAHALEEYRQDVFDRAKDPTAQRRLERLRRRWLSLNSAMIQTAKCEGEAARKERERLEAQEGEWLRRLEQLVQSSAELAQKQSHLDEREALLAARQRRMNEEIEHAEQARQQHLRMQDAVDTLAKAVYCDPGDAAVDRAA